MPMRVEVEEKSALDVEALQARVEELSALYLKLSTDSSRNAKRLEERLLEQEIINDKLMKAVSGTANQGISSPGYSDDTEQSGLNFSFEGLQAMENTGDSKEENHAEKEKLHTPASGCKSTARPVSQTVHTQTALAIDPQTSVKLSFISAGISTYGSTIEDTPLNFGVSKSMRRSAEFGSSTQRHSSHHHSQEEFDDYVAHRKGQVQHSPYANQYDTPAAGAASSTVHPQGYNRHTPQVTSYGMPRQSYAVSDKQESRTQSNPYTPTVPMRQSCLPQEQERFRNHQHHHQQHQQQQQQSSLLSKSVRSSGGGRDDVDEGNSSSSSSFSAQRSSPPSLDPPTTSSTTVRQPHMYTHSQHTSHSRDHTHDDSRIYHNDHKQQLETPLRSILRTPTRPPTHTPITSAHQELSQHQDESRYHTSYAGMTPGSGRGPLHTYSPSLSPINSIHSTLNYSACDDNNLHFDPPRLGMGHMYAPSGVAMDIPDGGDSGGRGFFFVSPARLHVNSSPEDDNVLYEKSITTPIDSSLHSLSLLDMTGATLADRSGMGNHSEQRHSLLSGHHTQQHSYNPEPVYNYQYAWPASQPHRRNSPGEGLCSYDLSPPMHFSGQDATRGNREGEHDLRSPSMRQSNSTSPSLLLSNRYPSTTHYRTTSSSMPASVSGTKSAKTLYYLPAHHHQLTPASKKSSKFWKNRLGTRDMTSILGSPISTSLFT